MGRKPAVRNGILNPGDADRPNNAIALEGAQWAEWQQWLAQHGAFVYYGQGGHFTAQRELRRGHAYWYGYRRRGGKLHKVYLGRPTELDLARLEAANTTLAGALDAPRAAAPATPPGQPPKESSLRLAWTRLAPPALPPRLVERRRLTQRINTPLTLLYAPSGFGKSTLLNEWRQGCRRPVAWVSLTEAENEPVRFWVLLATAIQLAVEPEVEPALDWPVAGEDQLPHLLERLSGELAQRLEAGPAPAGAGPAGGLRLSIVLDNYHHIRNPRINGLLQGWLEQWPPALQLILAGHIRPPLAVSRLRARGLVTELDADDLRFTVEEGVQFLQQHQAALGEAAQDGLAQRDMEMLVQRTRGWASGLILAAMALARHGDRQAFLESFSGAHSYLSEYFLENVFERQSSDVQTFLLQTAILRQLTGSLCDAVTGREDSARLLQWLWQENLFLVQTEQPGVYQYHAMFAEALQSELGRRMAASKPHLHRRAAEWHRGRQEIDEAVYHLLAIGAWEEAATLIEEIALRELVEFGEDSRLLRWLRQLPAGVVQQHKTLLLLFVRLARMGLSVHEVGRFLTNVAERIRARLPGERTGDEVEVLAEIERMRRQGQGDGLLPWAAPASGRHAGAWQLLAALDESLHTAFRGLDPGEEEICLALYAAARQENNLFVVLMAGGNCVTKFFLVGQLRHARQIGEQVLQYALARRSTLPEPASIALHGLACIAFERDELERCEELLARVRETDPNPTSTNMPMSAAILAARLQAARGEGAAAQRTLQSARALHARRPSGVWQDQDLLEYQAWCALRSGDGAAAQALLAGGSDDLHAVGGLVRAELLLEQGQPAATAALLQGLLDRQPQHLLRESHLRTRLLLAAALFEQGQVVAARRLLAAALRAAASEGAVRPFRELAAALGSLLGIVAQQEPLSVEARQFLRPLLPAGSDRRWGEDMHAATGAGPGALAALTPREQEVLRLVAAGHTNAAIARRLTLAESTVKTHLANIYTKLRARNRVEAVARLQAARQAQG